MPAIQLGHAGRKASCGPPWTNFKPLTEEDAKHGMKPWRAIAPSAIPTRAEAPVPHELTVDEIKEVLLQVAAYAGVPAGIDGFRLAREAFAEMEAAKK